MLAPSLSREKLPENVPVSHGHVAATYKHAAAGVISGVIRDGAVDHGQRTSIIEDTAPQRM